MTTENSIAAAPRLGDNGESSTSNVDSLAINSGTSTGTVSNSRGVDGRLALEKKRLYEQHSKQKSSQQTKHGGDGSAKAVESSGGGRSSSRHGNRARDKKGVSVSVDGSGSRVVPPSPAPQTKAAAAAADISGRRSNAGQKSRQHETRTGAARTAAAAAATGSQATETAAAAVNAADDGQDEQQFPRRRTGKNKGKNRNRNKGKNVSVGGGRRFNGALTASGEIDSVRGDENMHVHGGGSSSGDEQVEAAATLSTSLARQLTQGAYECMICCDSVRARQAVWQCDRCWAIFHLGCVQRWASASTGAGTGADGGRWRCPGCQHARAAAPTHYVCFCGATRNPPMARRGAVPHACGQTCGRRRGAHCPHACTQACHPGPCPPCTALAPEQACFCGRTVFRQRCGASYDPADGGQSCGAPCGETLGCGRHTCTQPCHGGLCAACPRTVTQRCHCGRHQRQAACGASPSYDCGEACEALLACGVHTCGRTCHPTDDGSHEVCALDPATAATCHCGAQSAAALGAPRASCADPVPSCGAPCGRRRADCDHPCPAPCHAGECPPCAAAVRKPCRCGAETAASAVCGQPALCDRVCALKRQCRRHRCNATCCPGDAAHHACPLTCNRLLACKQHRCAATCHAGPCAPCQTTSSVPLVCGCGRTRVEAPVACGASLPACRFACERVRACGHYSVAAHECHAADTACPPCAVLVTTPCMCGARELRSIPCYRAGGASCGRICGRLLACGGHTCQRSCHRPDDMCLAPGASCQQRCGKPRKACGHACILPCHSPAMCSEALPCAAKVDVACACGRLTAQRTCGATSVAPSSGAAPLECDELCRVAERNRRVALALGLSERADAPLDGLARMRYSDAVLQFARAHSAWVRDIEAQLAAFVGDRARAALNFPPMRPRQRAFLHALAPAYGCSSRSVDREPVRSVCWARTPHTTLPSIVPSAAARYARPPAVVCSDRVLAAEEADFDDAASHIFEPAQPPVPAPASASVPASAADRQRRKIDFLAISDLRHGLTVDELRAAIDRLLLQPSSPRAPYALRWVSDDLVEMRCTEEAARNECLAKWEALLRKKLPHTGLAGMVVAQQAQESLVQPAAQLPPLVNSRLPKPSAAATASASTPAAQALESDREVPENWESLE